MNNMIEFGTGGWRAVIGDGFTRQNIRILAKALATKMKNEGVEDEGIVIGYDRRFLSKEAMQWAACIFAAEGIQAKLINQSVPTPMVMYYVMKHALPYGIMVTASHNPAIYNGFKIFTAGGRDADEYQTKDIEEYCADVSEEEIRETDYSGAVKSGLVREIYPLNEYLDNIISQIDIERIRSAGLRIALDPMYGVSETSLATIFHTARCSLFTINERHDTLFGGKLPSPSAGTLKALQNHVLDNRCDIGIATDGDADRIGIIDDKGNFLHPNDILVILYYYLVTYKHWRGPVVRNIATTHRLDRLAKEFGENCYEVPVGFKHISSKMNETDAVIGGESSGGLTVRGHIKGKDGVYAAALLVEMIAVTGKKLSAIMEEIQEKFGPDYMMEKDYRFDQAKKEEIQKILFQEKRLPELELEVERVSYLDGCKVYFKNGGWIICRFSGTEPLLRIFCEMAEEKDVIKSICSFEDFFEL